MASIIRKIFINKKNKQLSLTLPKKLKIFKKKTPKKIKFKIEELIW